MIDLKKAKQNDPVKKQEEKDLTGEEWSPMNPPDAYEIPNEIDEVSYEQMPLILRELSDDHHNLKDKLEEMEEALKNFKENNWALGEEGNATLKSFFSMVDETLFPHQRKEEKVLFPLVKERMLAQGEHSKDPIGTATRTAIDILEDDHLKVIQLNGLIFNLLGMASRLPNPESRTLLLDATYEQARSMVETLKLHIHREDKTVFPLACQLISNEEFQELEAKKAYC